MKKSTVLLSTVVLHLLFATCTNDKKLPVFEKEEIASFSPVPNSPFMGLPVGVIPFNDQLIISDFQMDTMITVFDLRDNKVTAQVAPKGLGPNESQPPLTIFMLNDTLFAYEMTQFKLSYYTFEDGIEINEKKNLLFRTPTQVFKLTAIDKDHYLAFGTFDKGRYAILNEKGEVVSEFGEYPNFLAGEKDRPNDAKAMFHGVLFASNKKVKKVAASSPYVLDIIDLSNEIHVSKRVFLAPYDYTFSSGNVLWAKKTKDTPPGAIGVTVTENFIYVLVAKTTKTKEIWVFDWEGNAVKKVTIHGNIRMITAVDDSLLYAIALIEEDYAIVRIEM
jgi:hypothetical protein